MNTKVWYLPYLNYWSILECECMYGTYGSYYELAYRSCTHCEHAR